jgi:nucleotide-binding universal stress UspA family protein
METAIEEVGCMFEKILVPVDGSETSWRALQEAKELATAFKGELYVVNVIQPYNNSAMLIVPLDQATISQGNAELAKIGGSVLQTAKNKLKDFTGKKDFDLEVGHPSERILAICKEKQCTAIVIGSRGLSGIAEFFLGSVSSKVSQYADVPVLIVK